MIILNSCKSYYIPIDSFRQQFAGIDSFEMRRVATRGPMGGVVRYETYPIDYIECVDKNGNPAELANGPSIEMRITDTNNHRVVFNFDLIRVENNSIIGVESRFLPSIKKRISLDAIKTIEVQDGKKKFRYVD